MVAKRAKDLQASLELARKLPIGDIVALETGDFRRTQREGGGSQHGFLLARVLQQEERGERKAHRVAGDRAMRTFENETYRQGDVIILLRLLDRDDGNNTGLGQFAHMFVKFREPQGDWTSAAGGTRASCNGRWVDATSD